MNWLQSRWTTLLLMILVWSSYALIDHDWKFVIVATGGAASALFAHYVVMK